MTTTNLPDDAFRLALVEGIASLEERVTRAELGLAQLQASIEERVRVEVDSQVAETLEIAVELLKNVPYEAAVA